jgi:DnaK suppressor protein
MNTINGTQLARLKQIIDTRDRQLRDEISDALLESGDQRYIALAGQVHDLGDEAVANELIEVENALIERHVRELRGIEVARERLAGGKINECIECGEEIGFKRLLASPVAVRCIECQDRFDRIHAHEPNPRM